VPASSVVVKKKGTHPSSASGPSSSSSVVRPVATKLEEARRRTAEKEPVLVMLEVDMSSDSEPVVGKCRHCFDANGKTCLRWMHTGFKCGSKRDKVSSNNGLLS